MKFEQAMEAIRDGDLERLGTLLRENAGLSDATDDNDLSLLMQALYHQKPELVEYLADLRPLGYFEAAASGRLERLVDCLESGRAGIDDRAPDGFTALHLAAFFGQEQIATELLRRGASVVAIADNPTSVQPLHSAVAGRSLAIVSALLVAGAPIDARQQAGFTPLMAAAANGLVQLIERLLEAGADPALASDDGKTARDFAVERHHDEIARLLEAAASSID